MKQFRRMISILTITIIIIGILTAHVPVSAEEANDVFEFMYEEGILYYSTNNNEVTIVGGFPYNPDLNIPAEISGCPVTAIGEESFMSCYSLEKIVLPDSVTTICDRAFSDCQYLREVRFSPNISKVGKLAFSVCTNLTEAYLPNTVDLGVKAFTDCSSLKKVVLSEKLTAILDNTFSYCSSLSDVKNLSSVRSFGKRAFFQCSKLPSFTFSENTEEIGDEAFFGCRSFSEVCLPKNAIIGKGTFGFCEGLKKATLPENVDTIPEAMFKGCKSLTMVNNISEIRYFGKEAFRDCESLPDFSFSDATEEIGESAFQGCNSLVNVVIPGTVKTFGNSSFDSCKSLKSVKVVKGIKEIPTSAFANCESLKKVILPDGVTKIGSVAFYMCKKAESIILPDSVEEISTGAFYYCSGLTAFNIPEGVRKVGADAIKDSGYYMDRLNWEDGCLCINHVLFSGVLVKESEEVTIKNGIKVIADEAFTFRKMKSAVLPDSVETIGKEAFSYCENLESVYLPDGVTEIEDRAFFNCDSLSEIIIPAGVKAIGKYAFGYKYVGTTPETVGITIKGYSGTAAEEYANQNGISFVDLGQSQYPSASHTFETESVTVSESETVTDTETTTEPTETETATESESEIVSGSETVKETEPSETKKAAESETESVAETVTEPSIPPTPAKLSIEKKAQIIKAKSYKLVYGAKSFRIKASAKGKLTYSVEQNSVIKLSSNGKIRITGCGIVYVKIKAAKTKTYKAAAGRIKITVRPPKAVLIRGSGTTARYVIYFRKLPKISGYQLLYRAEGDKKWKKEYAEKNATKIVLKNLKYNKYSIKLRGYKLVGKKKLYGAFAEGRF